MEDIFKILTVAPNLIQIEVIDIKKFKQDSQDLKIGSYLKISDSSDTSIIALVQSFKIKDPNKEGGDIEQQKQNFIIDAQPIGFLDENQKFRRGG
ncbi:MAG: hypothetical protein Q4A42_07270 [Tissierellia bacterium]|nr:hypothetical protein [Tissierellia bacterium]